MPDREQIPSVNLNLNVRGLPVSATLGINELCQRLTREGRHVYKFGLGQSPFPVPEPVEEALKVNAHQKDYLPVMGLWRLREQVSSYLSRTQGVSFSPDDVMIGPGSKELMFILQLVYYGDLVIPTPSWVSYAPQAHIIGRHIHWTPTSSNYCWELTPDAIEAICHTDPDRPRLIILNYPANPHGCTYSAVELQDIARIARKYRVLLLSDEIYGELHHEGEHLSIARYYPEGTIISGGLSKWCGAGGWRLGTFAFPRTLRWLRDAMATVASETYTSTSAPIQFAAVRAFKGGTEIEHYLVQSRRILKALGRHMARKLREIGIGVPDPHGAFYLFPDFSVFRERLEQRGFRTSDDMCRSLLDDTGVAVIPGHAFGRPADEFTARIAYVDFDGARALSHADTIPIDEPLDAHFLEVFCPQCVYGIDALCRWFCEA